MTHIKSAKRVKYLEKIKATGNCLKINVIYAAQCSMHKVFYIGFVLSGIKRRPDINELTKRLHRNHDINVDLIQLHYNIISETQPPKDATKINGFLD